MDEHLAALRILKNAVVLGCIGLLKVVHGLLHPQ